jgi:hypothetical protein
MKIPRDGVRGSTSSGAHSRLARSNFAHFPDCQQLAGTGSSSRTTALSSGYHGKVMANTDFCRYDAARAKLAEIATKLDAASAAYPAGSTWTVATSLSHLAFWERRGLFQFKRWQGSGSIEAVRLDPQSAASIQAGSR